MSRQRLANWIFALVHGKVCERELRFVFLLNTSKYKTLTMYKLIVASMFLAGATLLPNNIFSQELPAQFEYPCDEGSLPFDQDFNSLTRLLTVDGENLDQGDYIAAFNSFNQVIGRGQVDVGVGCDGEQSIIIMSVFGEATGCVENFGALEGEDVVVLAFHNGLFYQVPGPFIYVTSENEFAFPPGGFCEVVNLTDANLVDALPVSLESFRGYPLNNKAVQLDWVTVREEQVAHFEVEQSTDGSDWQMLDRITAAGDSEVAQHYEFTDFAVSQSVNYYRLKMVDTDESFTYSSVVLVEFNPDDERSLHVFPNPVGATEDMINLQLRGDWNATLPIQAFIYDIRGRMMKHFTTLTAGNASLSLPDRLPPGLYFLEVRQEVNAVREKVMIR